MSDGPNPPAPAIIHHTRGVVRFLADRATPIEVATAPPPPPPEPTKPTTPVWSDEQKADITALAVLVAGANPPPDWLLQGLPNAILAVRFALRDEAAHPDRVPLTERLDRARQAAALLAAELGGGAVMTAIEETRRPPIEGEEDRDEEAERQERFDAIGAAWRAVTDLIPLIDTAITAIPVGQGRSKHYPRPVRPPQAVCALAIVCAWRGARGNLPPHTARDPQKACRLLWNLATDPAQSWGDNPTGWRDHLKPAKEASKDERAEMEQLLGLRPKTCKSDL